MKYLHIYILNKFERSKLLRSQILNMLTLEENAIVIFVKCKHTNDNYIHCLMGEYNFNYIITNNFTELVSEVKKIKKTCLVHSRDFYIIALLGFLKNNVFHNTKMFLLLDVRGLDYEEAIYNNKSFINVIKAKIKELIIWYAVKKSNALSTVTGNLRKIIIKRYRVPDSKPILIIPTCIIKSYINKYYIKNTINEQVKIAYTGGTFSKWHRIDDVIGAMILIKREYPLTEFFFCVDDVELVKRKLKRRGLDAVVEHCTNVEVINLLRKTDYGLIIRDDNILNKVAAPTKLTEYLVTNNRVIYSGRIGIIDDLRIFDIDDIIINLSDIIKKRKIIHKTEINVTRGLIYYFLWENNVSKYRCLMQMLIKD